VEQWSEKGLPSHEDSGSIISGPALLSEGMTEEQIVKAIGSPLERRRTGEGLELWKYSAFTLALEAGKLRSIR
jgi:hypothetical protein